MNAMIRVDLNAIIRGPLSEKDWHDIVELQCRWPALTPVRYGAFEPVQKRFDPNRISDAVSDCRKQSPRLPWFIWEGARPGWNGGMGVEYWPMNTYAPLAVAGALEEDESPADLTEFLCAVAVKFNAVFAFVHSTVEAEIKVWGQEAAGVVARLGVKTSKYAVGYSPMRLAHWLPDVFWATIFGEPYIKLFGRDRLLTAPAAVVRELSPTAFYVQLTDSINDGSRNFVAFNSVREKVKNHLGINAFWRYGMPSDYKYSVPAEFCRDRES